MASSAAGAPPALVPRRAATRGSRATRWAAQPSTRRHWGNWGDSSRPASLVFVGSGGRRATTAKRTGAAAPPTPRTAEAEWSSDEDEGGDEVGGALLLPMQSSFGSLPSSPHPACPSTSTPSSRTVFASFASNFQLPAFPLRAYEDLFVAVCLAPDCSLRLMAASALFPSVACPETCPSLCPTQLSVSRLPDPSEEARKKLKAALDLPSSSLDTPAMHEFANPRVAALDKLLGLLSAALETFNSSPSLSASGASASKLVNSNGAYAELMGEYDVEKLKDFFMKRPWEVAIRLLQFVRVALRVQDAWVRDEELPEEQRTRGAVLRAAVSELGPVFVKVKEHGDWKNARGARREGHVRGSERNRRNAFNVAGGGGRR